MKYQIESASACYSGGGIYLSWGKLGNGLWFCGSFADGFVIVKNNPSTLIDNDFAFLDFDWLKENLVECIADNMFCEFANAVIDHILKNGSAECQNYLIEDLEKIKKDYEGEH